MSSIATDPREYFNIGGVNTYVNPVPEDGQMIHCVNMISFPYGAKTKRSGYNAFLNVSSASAVHTLFTWEQYSSSGTIRNLYRADGGTQGLYYAPINTGSSGTWTPAIAKSGTSTVTFNQSSVQYTYESLGTSLFLAQGESDPLMISTNGSIFNYIVSGTTYLNTGPTSRYIKEFQRRLYAFGPNAENPQVNTKTLGYSVANDGANWSASGTSDSSSFNVQGAGTPVALFKSQDKLFLPFNSGQMYKWDGYSIIDMTTQNAPSSQKSIGYIENIPNYINNYGHYAIINERPKLLSNAIQRQFYNNKNTGITGAALSNAAGVGHIYDYLVSVGTTTDDFTSRTIANNIIKYDMLKNEYLNWSFSHYPTAWHSYKDSTNNLQLIFGDNLGQVYKMDSTTLSDNGLPIEAEMVFVFNYGVPEYDKLWRYLWLYFNPGCQAKVQVACSDAFTYDFLEWKEVGDVSDGTVEFRFPPGSRSKFLFLRIYESSTNARFSYYGCAIKATVQSID